MTLLKWIKAQGQTVRLYFVRTPNYEYEFLPAVSEVETTPASPLGRTIGMVIIAVFAIALIWSYFGFIDVDAVAQGKLEPLGGAKVIQSFETGVVKRILVQDGAHVQAGQVLLELETNEEVADLSQLKRQLLTAQLDKDRNATLLGSIKRNRLQPLRGIDSSTLLIQQHWLQVQWEAFEQHKATLLAQQNETNAGIIASQYEQQRLDKKVHLMEEKAQALHTLHEKKIISRFQWLEAEQERVDAAEQAKIAQRRLEHGHASLARQRAELQQFIAETLRQAMTEFSEAQNKEAEAQINLTRYHERENHRILRSPVAGTVQQLALTTLGGVVKPAEPLMVVAPDTATLVVKAKLANQDVAFVHKGQMVNLKIDSYPYTRYGILPGKVLTVSTDAINDEKLGPVYGLTVSVPHPARSNTAHQLVLRAGMTVTAEVKTNRRRVLDYLLSPIRETFSEAGRER